MALTATELRKNIYKLLDEILETGNPLEIERKGKRLRIFPDEPKSKLDNLKKRNSKFSIKTLKLIEKNSPLSVSCTFEIIKILKRIENLTIKDSLDYEYRFTYRAVENSDFIEGIRAQVIDKDRNPNWQHNNIKDVPHEKVQKMLKPLNLN